MKDYQAPWWRNQVIKTAEERRREKEQNIILLILCVLTVVLTGLYQLVRYVEAEATTRERERIFQMVQDNRDELKLFIMEMERAGKGK